jgi:hypothetical protein
MLSYFYYPSIPMEETSYFSPFFDDFKDNHDYYHYIGILDYEAELPQIVKVIVEHIMERIRSNNIDIMLEVDDLPVLCVIPKEHLMILIGEYILKSSQLMARPITVIAEEFSVNNRQTTRSTDKTYERNDSTFTKEDYVLLIRLLKAKIMQFSVDVYMKSYTCAHDQYDEKRAVAAIVKFIDDNVFWDKDISYANLFKPSYIPSLFMNQSDLTLHVFPKDHPLIVERAINIVKDLSNCFTDKSLPELYSELLTIINYWIMAEPEIAIIVETNDDYEYIKLLTNNCRNGMIKVIYHDTMHFIESCKRFYKEYMDSNTCYPIPLKDPVIKQLIALHDLQQGLTNDEYEYPEHPPDDMDMLPKPLRHILYKIGKCVI